MYILYTICSYFNEPQFVLLHLVQRAPCFLIILIFVGGHKRSFIFISIRRRIFCKLHGFVWMQWEVLDIMLSRVKEFKINTRLNIYLKIFVLSIAVYVSQLALKNHSRNIKNIK